MYFANRLEAGKLLGNKLKELCFGPDTIVLGLPRGGAPIAVEVAAILNLPVDLLIVRKIGSPSHREYAIGALAEGSEAVWSEDGKAIKEKDYQGVQHVLQEEKKELKRRIEKFRSIYPALNLQDKRAIIVDDGLATGLTAAVAAKSAALKGAKEIIIAVPVASIDACQYVQAFADQVICLHTPEDFYAVGQWYQDFAQLSDEDVENAMKKIRPLTGKK